MNGRMTVENYTMSESFAELFEESIASQKIKPGTILTAWVVDIGPDIVVVHAGLKSEAAIPVDEFLNERGEIEVSVGDEVEVALDAVEDGFGETRLSREKAKRARTWTRLEEIFESQEIVTGVINGGVKGGFSLGRPAAEISLRDVVEVCEGGIVLNHCLRSVNPCKDAENCAVADVWREAQDALTGALDRTNLADVI